MEDVGKMREIAVREKWYVLASMIARLEGARVWTYLRSKSRSPSGITTKEQTTTR
jgi:hypothetical protein